ncbi:MAG: hypothetical protein NC078_06740 [Ruminococcus sp.]|nr:hypothetical protein [Ruminococcus sp.]
MKKITFMSLCLAMVLVFTGCNSGSTYNPSVTVSVSDNDGTIQSGSGNNMAGNDVNVDNSVHQQNITFYVDKVQTDLIDVNGNVVMPFASNAELYVPITSLGDILEKPVEWDRTSNAVYVGESPNRSANMLDFLHGYDPQYITEYSFLENKGAEYFSMAGKNYTDGMVAYELGVSHTASINFNLEGNYSNLSFRFGHLDGTAMYPTTLIIKLDGYVERKIDVNAEDYPIDIELDVSNAMQLRFELEMTYSTGYAFTDMTLSESELISTVTDGSSSKT